MNPTTPVRKPFWLSRTKLAAVLFIVVTAYNGFASPELLNLPAIPVQAYAVFAALGIWGVKIGQEDTAALILESQLVMSRYGGGVTVLSSEPEESPVKSNSFGA